MTIEQAKAKVVAAEAAYMSGTVKERAELFNEWTAAERAYNVTVANTAADSLAEPIGRDALVVELDKAIRSKLSFGLAVLQALEREQSRGGRLDRYDIRARDASGGYRPITPKAFERAVGVLEKHCPRRSDTGCLAPPYRVKSHEAHGIIAVGGEHDPSLR